MPSEKAEEQKLQGLFKFGITYQVTIVILNVVKNDNRYLVLVSQLDATLNRPWQKLALIRFCNSTIFTNFAVKKQGGDMDRKKWGTRRSSPHASRPQSLLQHLRQPRLDLVISQPTLKAVYNRAALIYEEQPGFRRQAPLFGGLHLGLIRPLVAL